MEFFNPIHQRFLEKWPVERLGSLTLKEYTLGHGGYKESFSYWVETETEPLGGISGLGGGGSLKHGIYYKTNKEKEFKRDAISSDSIYAWWNKYGATAEEAFSKIKGLLLETIKYSRSGQLQEIDKIDFFPSVKWKWAFLYSTDKLIPVYKHEALEVAAKVLGYTENDFSYPALYLYLINQKRQSETRIELGERIWEIYSANKPVNYYILGSKYGVRDVFPEMLERNVICTGFSSSIDLEDYLFRKQKEIKEFLQKAGQENAAADCLKLFLNIKPGDKIAIKADGSPKGKKPFLSITAIAEAFEDNDGYYTFDPSGLGHCLKVKWINAPVYKEFAIGGYGKTIHKITGDDELIKTIFNSFYESGYLKRPNEKNEKMKNRQLNTILYGPPGTGKTFRLKEIINEWDLIEKTDKKLPSYDEFVLDYTWWQIIAMALYDKNHSIEVPELREHPLIKAKYRTSTLKNINARLWSTMQQNSSDSCSNVKLKNKKGSCRIFYKENDSTWRLENREEFAIEYQELVADLEYLMSPIKTSNSIKHYTFTTCHQSLSYEDFIEGIKPNIARENETENEYKLYYEYKKGLFYQACEKAAQRAGYLNLHNCLEDSEENRKRIFENALKENKIHVFFMDEINRCNIASVFGELITLIEKDKRLGEEYEIADTRLPYSNRIFGVPANLFIIGTMNTADRSVEALDTALRRRFSFRHLPPDDQLVPEKLGKINLRQTFNIINERIKYLTDEDHQIGHSFLMNIKDYEQLKEVFRDSIIPLLKEFFFNDYGKIRMILGTGFVKYSETEDAGKLFSVDDHDFIVEKPTYSFKRLDEKFDIESALFELIKNG